MDFMAFHAPNILPLVIAGAVVVIAGFIAVGISARKPWLNAMGTVAIVLGIVGAVISSVAISSSAEMNFRTAAAKALGESYGITLDSSEFWALDYPMGPEVPATDFEPYGSIPKLLKTEDGYKEHRLYLVWDQGQMLLAESENGESFKELQR